MIFNGTTCVCDANYYKTPPELAKRDPTCPDCGNESVCPECKNNSVKTSEEMHANVPQASTASKAHRQR